MKAKKSPKNGLPQNKQPTETISRPPANKNERRGRLNVQDQRREALREQLWPNSSSAIWSRHENYGFTTIPRLLPLVMSLITRLSKKGDPSMVYLGLWTRAFDQGIISNPDEVVMAYEAGYSGTRAVRSWRERIFALRELGFIKIRSQGNREIGHVLILNPLAVCAKLFKAKPNEVSEEWWTAFVARANEIGAALPDLSQPLHE